jgi:hypothetical protein
MQRYKLIGLEVLFWSNLMMPTASLDLSFSWFSGLCVWPVYGTGTVRYEASGEKRKFVLYS